MKTFANRLRRAALRAGAFAAIMGTPAVALAQAVDWQIYFEEPASPIMQRVLDFNNPLMVVITLIVLFVLALLGWVIIRYNSRRNPVPSRTTHNTMVEVLWTVVPVLILVGIAIPSFSLLFAQYDPARAIEDYNPDEAITIKAIGQAGWYWTYEYPDNGNIRVDSFIVRDEAGNYAGEPRLLETTAPMVVPVDVVIHLQATADPTGVIHAFALPALATKIDAVPGRINEMWFRADREGIFYGQCSELCGAGHAFMPIEMHVVSQDQFAEWSEVVLADPTAANGLLDTWEEERLAALD